MDPGLTAEPSASPPRHYEEYFGPALFAPLADVTVRYAGPQRGERVLDVACGTGIVTRRLAAAVGPHGHAVGLDVNPAMLAEARSRTESAGTGIEWVVADAEATGLPDEDFDLVVCQQGLQFVRDRAVAMREMRRVLRHGGRVTLAAWQGLDRHPLFAAITDAEEEHLTALGTGVSRADLEAPFVLGDAAEIRGLLEAAGFVNVEVAAQSFQAHFADADRFVQRMEYAYSAVIPQFATDPQAFANYVSRVALSAKGVVERHRHGDEIVVPMHANLITARRGS